MLHKKLKPFPSDFLWGASTSAYQVEGANLIDGKEADLAVKVLYRSFFQKKERICLNRRNSNSRDFRALCTKTHRGTVEG